MSLAPIVFLVYNRLSHTQKTFEAILKNELAQDTEVFIFCDGAKNEVDQPRVLEVRNFVRGIKGFKSITIIDSEKNKGLANSVINGVSQVVKKFGKVIVLEDDLETSQYFLKYMNDALNKYETEERVMQISGYNYPIETKGLNETFFYRHGSSWGWATWARAWQHFEPNIDVLISKFDKKRKFRFCMDGSNPEFWKLMIQQQQVKVDSWAIRWCASFFIENGLVLRPRQSLVRNIGMDGTGVHCGASTIYDVELAKGEVVEFEEVIEESKLAHQHNKNYFIKISSSGLVNRMINRTKRMLGIVDELKIFSK